MGVQESLYAATVSLFALEQYEEAMELCGDLIAQNPDSTQVRNAICGGEEQRQADHFLP